MSEVGQKEFFVEEKREVKAKGKEKREKGVINDIPANVTIFGEPSYSGRLLRRTEEGESFPYRRRIRDRETMTMWYEGKGGRDYTEYLPTVLKRGPLVFVGDLRKEIPKSKLQYELPMPEKGR